VIVNGLQRVRPGVTVTPRDVEMIVRAQPSGRPAAKAETEAEAQAAAAPHS
jgi:hypothetical protein